MLEAEFSCQALVNIAWSLATLLGNSCAVHPPVRSLFALIHATAVARLAATAEVLRAGVPMPALLGQQQGGSGGGGGGSGGGGSSSSASGGFNEQALSNVVYAFDKGGCLTRDLLGNVFAVAVLRLQRAERLAAHQQQQQRQQQEQVAALAAAQAQAAGGSAAASAAAAAAAGAAAAASAPPLSAATFKPQELSTLLKACHSGIAPPWAFLAALFRLLSVAPALADGWQASERAELMRAHALLRQQQQEAQAQAQMQADERHQQAQARQLLGLLGLDGNGNGGDGGPNPPPPPVARATVLQPLMGAQPQTSLLGDTLFVGRATVSEQGQAGAWLGGGGAALSAPSPAASASASPLQASLAAPGAQRASLAPGPAAAAAPLGSPPPLSLSPPPMAADAPANAADGRGGGSGYDPMSSLSAMATAWRGSPLADDHPQQQQQQQAPEDAFAFRGF